MKQLTTEVVTETYKAMREYAKAHFGIPNGPDFPDFAKTMSENSDVCMSALLHFVLVGISGKEMAESVKDAKDDKGGIVKLVPQFSSFQGYVEAIYFGYLLGKRTAEAEILERMNT